MSITAHSRQQPEPWFDLTGAVGDNEIESVIERGFEEVASLHDIVRIFRSGALTPEGMASLLSIGASALDEVLSQIEVLLTEE